MRRLPLLLAALALLASACSALGAAPAATVGDTEITADDLEREIEAIRANERYLADLEEQYGAPTEGGAGTGTFDAAFLAQVLSLRVWVTAIEHDIDERGDGDVLEEVLAEYREALPPDFDQVYGAGAFDRFPEAYQDAIIDQFAIPEVVARSVEREIGDDEEAFYEANPDEFAEICIAHVLVGVQGGRTAAEALAIARGMKDQLDAGEVSFGDLAAESDDPGGADLGCGTRRELQFDPTFEQAAFTIEEGVPSDPVQTQFGSHIILTSDRRVPDFDEVADTVRLVMAEARQQRTQERIVQVVCDGDITVNPRYGRWTEDQACTGAVPRLPRVEPAEGPRSSTEDTGFQQ